MNLKDDLQPIAIEILERYNEGMLISHAYLKRKFGFKTLIFTEFEDDVYTDTEPVTTTEGSDMPEDVESAE